VRGGFEWICRYAAYGSWPIDARLDQIVSSLNAAGFETSSMCVFLPPSHPVAGEVRSVKSPYGELNNDHWIWASHRVARKPRWRCDSGSGFFVGARGYLHAVACGICQTGDRRTGALAKLGIPVDAAERYEARTREDASLVFVSCDGWAQSEWAREILRLLRAEEVCVRGENDESECDPPSLLRMSWYYGSPRTTGVPGRDDGRNGMPSQRPNS
jgi:hypothetical protein